MNDWPPPCWGPAITDMKCFKGRLRPPEASPVCGRQQIRNCHGRNSSWMVRILHWLKAAIKNTAFALLPKSIISSFKKMVKVVSKKKHWTPLNKDKTKKPTFQTILESFYSWPEPEALHWSRLSSDGESVIVPQSPYWLTGLQAALWLDDGWRWLLGTHSLAPPLQGQCCCQWHSRALGWLMVWPGSCHSQGHKQHPRGYPWLS